MINEYPKAVYKSKEDTITVHSIEAEEKAADEGYGDYSVVVLGKKPQHIIDKEEKDSDLEELTAKIKAELQKDSETAIQAQAVSHNKIVEDLHKKLEASEKNLVESNKSFEKANKEKRQRPAGSRHRTTAPPSTRSASVTRAAGCSRCRTVRTRPPRGSSAPAQSDRR